MGKTRPISLGVFLTLTAFVLGACGAPEGANDQESSAPATVTVTSTPESVQTEATEATEDTATPTDTTSPEQATPSETADDIPLGGSSPSPTDSAVLGEDVKGQSLTLSEFFQPGEDWTENRYDVADENNVSGIAGDITECGTGWSGPDRLELRLANNFEQLSFKVGQANQSESSRQTLVVRVVGNGNQIDIQRIPFNEVQDFDIDVEDVNALEIEFSLDEEVTDCTSLGESTAVLWDVELQ